MAWQTVFYSPISLAPFQPPPACPSRKITSLSILLIVSYIRLFARDLFHTLCMPIPILSSGIGKGPCRKGVGRLPYFHPPAIKPFLSCNELSSWWPVALHLSVVKFTCSPHFNVSMLEALANNIWLRYFAAMLESSRVGSQQK